MTIYEIKRRTSETSPYYFARDTMRFFGQTMKSFRIHKCEDGRYQISAPVYFRESIVNTSVRFFNPENNKLENE
jgi:hypothetical protein